MGGLEDGIFAMELKMRQGGDAYSINRNFSALAEGLSGHQETTSLASLAFDGPPQRISQLVDIRHPYDTRHRGPPASPRREDSTIGGVFAQRWPPPLRPSGRMLT